MVARISAIENDTSLSATKKLNALYILKTRADSCRSKKDSAYINLLLSLYGHELNLKHYNTALSYVLQVFALNDPKQKQFSKILQVKTYSILAHYYDQLLLLSKALNYYDSTIVAADELPAAVNYILDARLYKAYIYFRTGDFEKGIEESTIGLNLSSAQKDSLSYLRLLNQRAQSLFYQGNLQRSNDDIEATIQLAEKLGQSFQLASAYKMKGLIAARQQNFSLAEVFFEKMIKERSSTKRYAVVAVDYNDFGNFYRDSTQQYGKAKDCYYKAVKYASKTEDSAYLGMIYINLTKTFFYEKDYVRAEQYYLKQMKFLNLSAGNDFLLNPGAKAINLIGNKHVIIALLQDKTELLLAEYKLHNDKKYLAATITTALLTDSVITQTQHDQVGEQSKLFWRNKTRQFYARAIEACYLGNETSLAFLFFEKSRAVLLNDQVNKLDATAYLPATISGKQENFQIRIIEQEQKLSLLSNTSASYITEQDKLLHLKEDYERFVRSIEQNYPVYYQYKYSDKVPSLQDLQQYLSQNRQNFVDYFMGDTVTYILAITPANTTFIRLAQDEFDKEKLFLFLKFCADKQTLNHNYNAFAELSNTIYKSIFQPLQLPAGRIIICADNVVIPFDALCTDAKGKQFLLKDYSFSYVYSARFLMKQFKKITAKGNFLGFAPVSFATHPKVADLKNAAEALHASAVYYENEKLFTHQNASRSNFFKYVPSYSVVSVFSHAYADTTESEPVLFMQDSLIRLTELQFLNNDPATKLVLLSACQTNVGKAATGEGIYSLARGFATAGIPSVAATLWKADEQTIYAVSQKFNEYLSEGMNKDEALQKAKLYFIEHNSAEKMLPYYWANMIVIGNTDAINFTTSNNNYGWWVAAGLLIAGLTVLILKKNFLNIRK